MYHAAPDFDSLPVNQKLMDAVAKGDIAAVKTLLDQGISANSREKDKDGVTALSATASLGRLDIVKLLVARGANVNVTEEWGENATMEAARSAHPEVLQFLIDHGGDVNADDDGITALDYLEGPHALRETPDEAERGRKCLNEIRAAGARHSPMIEMIIFGLFADFSAIFVLVASIRILIGKPVEKETQA